MPFINHYSVPIAWVLLLILGTSIVLRRGRKPHQWLILAGTVGAAALAWWFFRPLEEQSASNGSHPTLLELQSPYCFACVSQKPTVDRVAREFSDRLNVRRVNIQTAEGQKLIEQYQIEATPTFIFLDAAGSEQWRISGGLDVGRLRSSLGQ